MILKLKKHQVVALFEAITSLDKQDNQDDKGTRILNSQFRFKAAGVYALSKNLRKLTEAVRDIQTIRDQMIAKLKKTPEDKELTKENTALFVKDWNEFIETETELDLHAVKLADLDLDNNPVPLKTMAELNTVIVES